MPAPRTTFDVPLRTQWRAPLELQNTIQPYDWGSRTEIAELLGQVSPAPGPQAELWMGAHPKAPSRVKIDSTIVGLDEIIARHPVEILGAAVAKRFSNTLPFLYKVLSAAKPVSIQAHPTLRQAMEGYARENRAGIPLDAPHRNYRDANHKPEIIAPLTEFWALCGFRPVAEIAELLGRVPWAGLGPRASGKSLRSLFAWLLELGREDTRDLVAAAAARASDADALGDPDTARWVRKLATDHPADPGALAPLLLNVLHLHPGQAAFLDAGTLHAHLHGTGIELMANSDNVLRGGLTSKHVDVPELLETLRFEPSGDPRARTRSRSATEVEFVTPAEEFRLSVIDLECGGVHTPADPEVERGVEILLVTSGSCTVTCGARTLDLSQGRSCVIPAAAGAYEISGSCRIYRATAGIG